MLIDDTRRFAPATLRNRGPILELLRTVLPASGLVLEVASGTGEHIVHFARHLPALAWQPSEPSPEGRQSIAAWVAAEGSGNVMAPLDLDAAAADWPIARADAIVCINMIHISPWAVTEGLMRGTSRILASGALLYLYGPFRRADQPLAASNAAFDSDLRARDPRWGLREVADVVRCAAAQQLVFDRLVEMPAHNVSLVFRKSPGTRR